jgi:hypothetical protein
MRGMLGLLAPHDHGGVTGSLPQWRWFNKNAITYGTKHQEKQNNLLQVKPNTGNDCISNNHSFSSWLLSAYYIWRVGRIDFVQHKLLDKYSARSSY